MVLNKLKILLSLIIFSFLLTLTSCSQQINSVTKSSKPYYCIKGNFADLKIRFGTRIKTLDSLKNQVEKFYGYQINTNGEVMFFDDRNSSKKIITNDLAVLSDQDYCKIYHWSKKIIISNPVVNEIGDTLSYFEFENPATSVYQRNSWHPRFKTLGSKVTREYLDSINSVLRNYLKNIIE